jgi:hypothetical protein
MNAKLVKLIQFRKWNCELVRSEYRNNGRTALELVAAADDCYEGIYKGEPIATCTINIPEADLEPNEVIIKDYSENAGMLDALVESGVVEPTGKLVQSGFITAPVCILT